MCFLACLTLIIYGTKLVQARTTFLPDWAEDPMEFPSVDGGEDKNLCERSQNPKYVYKPNRPQCPSPKVVDKVCPHSEDWISGCVCPAEYNQTCNSPMRGVGESCDGKYKECCDSRCPSGSQSSSCSYPYVTDSTTTTGCGDTCYICRVGNDCNTSCGPDEEATPSGGTNDFNHQSCVSCSPKCTPMKDETGCKKTKSCDDGCGGTRTCCDNTPDPEEPEKVPGEPDNPGDEDKCLPNETGCKKTKECDNGCGGKRKCCDDTDTPDGKVCEGYSTTPCKAFETETKCKDNPKMVKCSATCLSTINSLGAVKEIDGKKVVSVPSQSNRIVVIENGTANNLPNVIITSAREYLKNMGKSASACPNTKPTLTTNGGKPSIFRDLNVNLNGTLSGGVSLDATTLTMSSSSKFDGSSLNLSNASKITGGVSGTTPAIKVQTLNISDGASSISTNGIHMSGSSASSARGNISTSWLKMDNRAYLALYGSAQLSAKNQGSYDQVQSGSGTNYGSSIAVLDSAKLYAGSGTKITAPRMLAAFGGAIIARGGYINATYDLWVGAYFKSADDYGIAGASQGGTFKTPEVSMAYGSCLCANTNSTFSSTADKGRYYDMKFAEGRAFKSGSDKGKFKWVTHKDQDKFNDTSNNCKRYETEWHKTSCDYICASRCKSVW